MQFKRVSPTCAFCDRRPQPGTYFFGSHCEVIHCCALRPVRATGLGHELHDRGTAVGCTTCRETSSRIVDTNACSRSGHQTAAGSEPYGLLDLPDALPAADASAPATSRSVESRPRPDTQQLLDEEKDKRTCEADGLPRQVAKARRKHSSSRP